ncbi:hypothetical protein [Flavobacterium sp. GNP002]
MLTREQVEISQKVQTEKRNAPALGELYLDFYLDEEYHLNSDLQFVALNLMNYENLILMLDILGEKNEFVINCVYYYMSQLMYYQGTGLDEYIALEYVREDVLNLFESYNAVKIEID